MFSIQKTIYRLQQSNEKAYYLAILRVIVCIWFLKEMLFRWPALKTLYSDQSFLTIAPEPSLLLFRLDPAWFKAHYMMVIYACVVLLLLNLLGIGRNLVAFLLFLAFVLLYSINSRYLNAGDKMSVILLFYLSFTNSYSYLTLFKRKPLPEPKEKLYNLLSNLAAYSIVLNLCFVYFAAGLAKLLNPFWQKGEAMYYFLNDERFFVFAAGGKHVGLPAFLLYIINYGTIMLEIAFPLVFLNKKCRNIILLICLVMHLGIYSFLMIYGMSILFIIQYGLFYSNEEVMALTGKIKGLFAKRFRFAEQ